MAEAACPFCRRGLALALVIAVAGCSGDKEQQKATQDETDRSAPAATVSVSSQASAELEARRMIEEELRRLGDQRMMYGSPGVRVEPRIWKQVAEVTNRGQVARLALPPRWGEDPALGASRWRYHPEDDPGASITIEHLPQPLSGSETAVLRQLLSKPSSTIAQADLKAARALDSESDAKTFELKTATSADLGGRRALIVEGRATSGDQAVLKVVVDGAAKEPAAVAVVVTFQAPRKAFDHWRPQIWSALQSIRWGSAKLPQCTCKPTDPLCDCL